MTPSPVSGSQTGMKTFDSMRHNWILGTARPPTAAGVLTSLLPSGVYLAAGAWAGTTVAMVATSVAAGAVMVGRFRRGTAVGVLLPATLIYLTLRTAAGLLTGSETVYFGVGLALSATVALAIGATAWTNTPAAAHLIPLVARYRHLRPSHPIYRRIAAHVTAAWAGAELAVTVLEARHLVHATGAEFVLAKTTIALPAMAGLVFGLIFYVRAQLDPVESHLARQYEQARFSHRPALATSVGSPSSAP